jgi:hypothetical protein
MNYRPKKDIHFGRRLSDISRDADNIMNGDNSFIPQTNYVHCCCDKHDVLVKLHLYFAYCSVVYSPKYGCNQGRRHRGAHSKQWGAR